MLDESLSSIKYIGPYLEQSFKTNSFWPPHSNTLHPIESKTKLINFIKTRRSNDKIELKKKITKWLRETLKNDRQGQCVGEISFHQGENYRYRVRQTNLEGYNAIIDFLRDKLYNTVHYYKIPNKLPRVRRYSSICKVGGI